MLSTGPTAPSFHYVLVTLVTLATVVTKMIFITLVDWVVVVENQQLGIVKQKPNKKFYNFYKLFLSEFSCEIFTSPDMGEKEMD